ncbi:CYFA0S23e00232g1_1 [Cyberlindnera fabianii]|uniref:Pre-mRNA-splicing factor ATP-dependent RNA helicase PRP16 n=1 Tax=Cyberlindnera fabianii TaxID=36022 RepID=A0A061B8W3_CYBFA|nr:CYFA0S23e00232g1_1 [Cyberlindnera fabianii]
MFKKRKPQRQRDADQWELNRLQTAGTLQRGAEDPDFESHEPVIQLTTHHLTPPFLDGSSIFTRQTAPVSAVRDPEGDLATFAKQGSEVVAKRRVEKERRSKAGDVTGIAGSAIGNVLGVKQTLEEDESNGKFRDTSQGEEPVYDKNKKTPKEQRKDLPAYAVRDEVLKLIRDHQVVVIIGETGSGKTTQLTQFLYEDGYAQRGLIGCTQPRRVAATSVAKRVSEEMEVKLGQEVGYTIRFEDETSDKTVIKYMTEGILLRETLMDANLDKYSCIIMDEAHERTVNTDVLLGLFRNLLSRRNDIKLIITSATMNADRFANFFGDAPQYTIPGRTFPVDIHFSRYPVRDYVEEAVKQTMIVHLQSKPGDILIFMTGQEDIDVTCDLLNAKLKQLDDPPPLDILPMYSTLPPEQQMKIFQTAKPGHRKVVVATNIAETSLTVDGIKFVIDTGFAKMKVYNSKLGMESLLITPIARANADQRSGRAGRTAAGSCYRLYTERASREEMYPQQIPEIQRTNLSNTLLLLKSLGVNDLLKFPFLDPPPKDTVTSSLYELWCIGALDNFGNLTELGKKMTKFPLQPALSKLLLTAAEKGCSEEMVIIVSMLSVPNVFIRPKERQEEADMARSRFSVPESDHLTLLNVYTQWRSKPTGADFWCKKNFLNSRSLRRAKDIKEQLEEIMKSNKLPVCSSGHEWDIVRKCIASGYFFQAAKIHGMTDFINLRTGMKLQLHPTSSLFGMADPPHYVVYHELMLTSKEFISVVTAVEPQWLVEYGGVFYSVREKGGSYKKRAIEEQLERDVKKYQEDLELSKERKKSVKKPVVQVGINKARRRRGF